MVATAVEETGLSTRTEQLTEIAPSMSAAAVEAEIKAAITVALKYPRKEDTAFQRLMKSCQRPGFAEDASYSFPRGDKDVSGASIYLAREAARLWGNIRHGLNVIADDEESRTIEAWAWDLESNNKVFAQDTFKKLIYRKRGGWIKPDERDLRELTNRRGAILKRNCILELMPTDLIDDARQEAVKTLQTHAAIDPEAAKKKVLYAFGQINVSVEMLEQKLGHPVGQSSPAEIAELRQIYKSIADGNSTWAEYVEPKRAEAESGKINLSDLKAGKEENRGHGQENLDQIGRKEAPKTTQAAPISPSKQPAKGKVDQPAVASKPAENPEYGQGSDPDPLLSGGDPFHREGGNND